jgi:hypothetical protein
LAGAVSETLGGWFPGAELIRKTLSEMSFTPVFFTQRTRTFADVATHDEETETV